MNLAKESRRLANFITELDDEFRFYAVEQNSMYNHIGALITDIILQAGLNYRTVVKPRVNRLLAEYPEAYNLRKFQNLVSQLGLENVINWKSEIKLNRIYSVIEFLDRNDINTCTDFKIYLLNEVNRRELQELEGIGPKTVDYLLKLLDFDVVAVDRHIYGFIEMAQIETKDYHYAKKVVEYAADLLDISRASLDYSIWFYMSDRYFEQPKVNIQLALEFKD